MSFYSLPNGVRNRLEKIQRVFFFFFFLWEEIILIGKSTELIGVLCAQVRGMVGWELEAFLLLIGLYWEMDREIHRGGGLHMQRSHLAQISG